MTLAHLHLLLNHVPTVGSACAFLLLLVSLIRRGDALRRVSLEAVYVIALATIPAYLSGVSAQQSLLNRPDIVPPLVEAHHDAALLSLLLIQLAGGAAWVALWRYRRKDKWSPSLVAATVLGLTVALAASAYAASLGGKIRHPEIVQGTTEIHGLDQPAAPGWLSVRTLSALVAEHEFVWPASEAAHFVGLWLVFGVVLMINLRMMGIGSAVPYRDAHIFLPLAAAGFALNMATGILFVVSMPHQYGENVSFLWKIVFLLIAGMSLLYATVFEGPWHLDGRTAPIRVKLAGLSGLLAWIAVMYFGRMLPYIGNAF